MLIGAVTDTSLLGVFDEAAIRTGRGLFYLNTELMSFGAAVDNGDGSWTLQDVRRSLVDTGWVGGAIGDTLYFFRDQVGFLNDDGPFEGKLQDVTGAGAYPLDQAALVALNGTGRADRPYPPDNVTVDDLRAVLPVIDGPVTIAWRERNRLTAPALLKLESDATEAPEAGTVYIVKVEDENGVEVFASPEVGTPEYELVPTDDMAGNSTVLVWAKRDGVLSYAAAPFPVIVGDFLKVDDEFLTVDGEKVSVE